MLKTSRLLCSLLLCLGLLSLGKNAFAIAESESRVGSVVGSLQPVGLSGATSGLLYGLHYGYMFSDATAFEAEFATGKAGDSFNHTGLSLLLNYYYWNNGTTFAGVVSGLTIIQNSLTLSGASQASQAAAISVGPSLDFDVSQRFLAGFRILYNNSFGGNVTVGTESVKVAATYTSIAARLAFVF